MKDSISFWDFKRRCRRKIERYIRKDGNLSPKLTEEALKLMYLLEDRWAYDNDPEREIKANIVLFIDEHTRKVANNKLNRLIYEKKIFTLDSNIMYIFEGIPCI